MVSDGLGSFFFGTERDTRRYRDPLMDILSENPTNSMLFVRRVMFIASISTASSSVPCSFYLAMNWEACKSCDKPLRWWLLINCIMSLIQLPLRAVFSLRLRYLSSQRVDRMTIGVHHLTSSRAWYLSKSLSLATYIWFVLGVFWTFTTNTCTKAPFLIHAAISVIVLSMLRLFLTLGSFYYYFPNPAPNTLWAPNDQGLLVGHLRPRPLTRAKIDSLPVTKYAASGAKRDSCAICLSDFENEDPIRKLTVCNHTFHLPCIDKWL